MVPMRSEYPRSALGAREIGDQLAAVLPDDVRRLVALDAPALRERTGDHRVEAELVVERRHELDRVREVARRREGSATGGPRGCTVARDVRRGDVVERLDDLRLRK